uniref:NADP-dependent oxidoreductase domain-containing protein n=1 Tax=Ditylenchus dipsaci TaxID=166011 RepID=A0A915DXB7_9BILA
MIYFKDWHVAIQARRGGQEVKIALSNGYKLLDCAQACENQAEIGAALKNLFDNGVVKREEVFITSKVWNTFHSYNLAMQSVEMTLAELQIDYLDLCLIHWPMGYKEGGACFLGKVIKCSFRMSTTWTPGKPWSRNIKQIQRVMDNCEIKPAVLQVECHPYFQQNVLIEFCNKNSIAVTAYSPLGNPAMPSTNLVIQISAQVLIQRGICVIVKSVSESRIKENNNIWDFTLTEEEMTKMKSLDRNMRFLDLKQTEAKGHPHFPW